MLPQVEESQRVEHFDVSVSALECVFVCICVRLWCSPSVLIRRGSLGLLGGRANIESIVSQQYLFTLSVRRAIQRICTRREDLGETHTVAQCSRVIFGWKPFEVHRAARWRTARKLRLVSCHVMWRRWQWQWQWRHAVARQAGLEAVFI